jgi:UDP-N-acetylglucosamine 4,6-dehydratase
MTDALAPLFLGRDFRSPRMDLDGKVVLITGGTGSFGRAFVAAVLAEYKPRKLIIFSRDELKAVRDGPGLPVRAPPLHALLHRRRARRAALEMAMRGVDFVIHAAALKHVPIAEYNPFECIKTNVHGRPERGLRRHHSGVQRVVALSTDKAANPINLYGASKLASDKIFCAAEAWRATRARPSAWSATATWWARADRSFPSSRSCSPRARASCRSPTRA